MKELHFSFPGLVALTSVSILSGGDKTVATQAEPSARTSKSTTGGALAWDVTTKPACFDPHTHPHPRRASKPNAFFRRSARCPYT